MYVFYLNPERTIHCVKGHLMLFWSLIDASGPYQLDGMSHHMTKIAWDKVDLHSHEKNTGPFTYPLKLSKKQQIRAFWI